MQVWLKPDVLQRLDHYCAMYGIGRGRAIGHLLKGALPDPSWVSAVESLLDHADRASESSGESLSFDGGDRQGDDPLDQELIELLQSDRPSARFRPFERVSNNNATRFGVISSEPVCWVEAVRLTSGELRPGHWSYAVAWDGQMGLTIRYAEDLLRTVDSTLPPALS